MIFSTYLLLLLFLIIQEGFHLSERSPLICHVNKEAVRSAF